MAIDVEGVAPAAKLPHGAGAPDEIAVSEEMITAGTTVLTGANYDFEGPEDVCREVYLAMRKLEKAPL
jgi:hypothetical protein